MSQVYIWAKCVPAYGYQGYSRTVARCREIKFLKKRRSECKVELLPVSDVLLQENLAGGHLLGVKQGSAVKRSCVKRFSTMKTPGTCGPARVPQ